MCDLITDNTLYYFFSTIAQVIAAMSALLAIFIQFKISELRDFLIGDGKAIYERTILNEKGYVLNKKYQDRLRDAIGRKSIEEIKEITEILKNNEIQERFTLKERPRGLQYLNNRYVRICDQIDSLQLLTKRTIITAVSAIILSIISIGLIGVINKSFVAEILALFINGILMLVTLILSTKGILLGIENRK